MRMQWVTDTNNCQLWSIVWWGYSLCALASKWRNSPDSLSAIILKLSSSSKSRPMTQFTNFTSYLLPLVPFSLGTSNPALFPVPARPALCPAQIRCSPSSSDYHPPTMLINCPRVGNWINHYPTLYTRNCLYLGAGHCRNKNGGRSRDSNLTGNTLPRLPALRIASSSLGLIANDFLLNWLYIFGFVSVLRPLGNSQ